VALLIVLAMASVVHGQATFDNRWYVDESATGLNDGTSWANAFTDLQDALAAAKVIEEETD